MKKIILVLSLICSFGLFAVTGADLLSARDAAIDEASFEINIDKVTAFNVTPHGNDEVLVSFRDEKVVHAFDCHFHGDEMACHADGDEHLVNKSIQEEGFDHILEGHTAGLIKLEKTLRRRNASLEVLESIKVWKLAKKDSSDDGHEHGADVWTKVIYSLGNKNFTVFIQCHEHGEKEEGFACHYKKTGKMEPTL